MPSILDDVRDDENLGMARQTEIRQDVFFERAELSAECDMLRRRQRLVAQHKHRSVGQFPPEPLHHGRRNRLARVDALHERSDMRRQRRESDL